MLYSFTISCVIQKNSGSYYNGKKGWASNIIRACLYTPAQIKRVLSRIHKLGNSGAIVLYMVQNNQFDYYGLRGWVYNLSEANFYNLKEAEALVKSLSS